MRQFEFQCLVVLKENVQTEDDIVSHFQIIIYCDQNWIHDIYIVMAHDMFLLLYCSFVVTGQRPTHGRSPCHIRS